MGIVQVADGIGLGIQVGIAADDADHGRHLVFLQQGIGIGKKALVAIVKGEQNGVLGKFAFSGGVSDELIGGDRGVACFLQPLKVAFQFLTGDHIIPQKTAVFFQHMVVHRHRHIHAFLVTSGEKGRLRLGPGPSEQKAKKGEQGCIAPGLLPKLLQKKTSF